MQLALMTVAVPRAFSHEFTEKTVEKHTTTLYSCCVLELLAGSDLHSYIGFVKPVTSLTLASGQVYKVPVDM